MSLQNEGITCHLKHKKWEKHTIGVLDYIECYYNISEVHIFLYCHKTVSVNIVIIGENPSKKFYKCMGVWG